MLVFATAEHLDCPSDSLAPGSPGWESLPKSVSILTPSQWSLEGLVACGVPPEQIGIAPHGVPRIFFDEVASRPLVRSARGWKGRFVFLHVGAATPNKNLQTLVRAFAALVRSFGEDAKGRRREAGGRRAKERKPLLVLKGLDALYGSRRPTESVLLDAFADGPDHWHEYVHQIYEDLARDQMAALYRGADAYVTASMAEAFQMPLAEALAAGLPIVAPAGGATEEVIDPSTTTLVPSVTIPRPQGGVLISADQGLFVAALEQVLRNTSKAARRSYSRRNIWASKFHTMERSADVVLAEVMKRRASMQ